jgi:hypothetical protein
MNPKTFLLMVEKPPYHSSRRSPLPRSPAFATILHPSSLPYNEKQLALLHPAPSCPDFLLIRHKFKQSYTIAISALYELVQKSCTAVKYDEPVWRTAAGDLLPKRKHLDANKYMN